MNNKSEEKIEKINEAIKKIQEITKQSNNSQKDILALVATLRENAKYINDYSKADTVQQEVAGTLTPLYEILKNLNTENKPITEILFPHLQPYTPPEIGSLTPDYSTHMPLVDVVRDKFKQFDKLVDTLKISRMVDKANQLKEITTLDKDDTKTADVGEASQSIRNRMKDLFTPMVTLIELNQQLNVRVIANRAPANEFAAEKRKAFLNKIEARKKIAANEAKAAANAAENAAKAAANAAAAHNAETNRVVANARARGATEANVDTIIAAREAGKAMAHGGKRRTHRKRKQRTHRKRKHTHRNRRH